MEKFTISHIASYEEGLSAERLIQKMLNEGYSLLETFKTPRYKNAVEVWIARTRLTRKFEKLPQHSIVKLCIRDFEILCMCKSLKSLAKKKDITFYAVITDQEEAEIKKNISDDEHLCQAFLHAKEKLNYYSREIKP